MARQNDSDILCTVFGSGKGSGAAMLMGGLGFAGVAVCVVFSLLLKKEKFRSR